jgi:hypothetical protein
LEKLLDREVIRKMNPIEKKLDCGCVIKVNINCKEHKLEMVKNFFKSLVNE